MTGDVSVANAAGVGSKPHSLRRRSESAAGLVVNKAALGVLTALISGCAVPATRQAVVPLSAGELGLASSATPVVDPAWWRSFGDPQLDRLVADATAGSPNLAAALARVAQAQAVLGQRRAEDGLNATLDAQAQGARLSGRYTIPPPYRGTVQSVGLVGANLAYNLDLFGRQRAAIEGARASTRAAALDLAAARLAIAGSVAETYLDLARAEQQAAIARRTIVAREGSLRLIRAQIRNRLASRVQQSAAETLVSQARGELVRAQGARALAANALAALAGRGPDYAAAIGPAAVRLDAGLPLAGAVPTDLLARRADIAAALARVDAAGAGKQFARRAFYPNVNLTALVGLQAIGLGNLLSLDAGQVGAGPAVSLPLLDNGRRRADLAGATAAVDVAVASYNDAVVGAVREAADAIALSNNLRAQQVQAAAVVRGFAETGRLNDVRVAAGLDSKLSLVDNDVRLLDARLAEADLAIDAAQARARLVLALGGGWTPEGSRP